MNDVLTEQAASGYVFTREDVTLIKIICSLNKGQGLGFIWFEPTWLKSYKLTKDGGVLNCTTEHTHEPTLSSY